MKTIITWSIISFAIILSIIEAIYGNSRRIIVYIGIFAFMWITDCIQKRTKKKA